jgi:hypothetical protein
MLNYSNSPQQATVPHFNVVITTPGHHMCAEYVKCLMATIHTLDANNISWIFQSEYASIITNAREATITGSRNLEVFNPAPGKGQYTYDKLFMIDSDIVWNPEQFLRLYASNKDLISAVYFEAQGADAMVHRAKNDFKPMKREEIQLLQQLDEPIEVYGVGLGFMCVKSGVFESLKRPWFGLGKVIQEVDGVVYELPLGEDLYFCEKVADQGHQVYLDPQVIVGHVKSNVVV